MNASLTTRRLLRCLSIAAVLVAATAGCDSPSAEKSNSGKSEVAVESTPENIAKSASAIESLAGKTITPEQRTQMLNKIVQINTLLHHPNYWDPKTGKCSLMPLASSEVVVCTGTVLGRRIVSL